MGLGGFNNLSTSLISSSLSGSIPTIACQPLLLQSASTSWALCSVCTLTIAGFFLLPNLLIFICFCVLWISFLPLNPIFTNFSIRGKWSSASCPEFLQACIALSITLRNLSHLIYSNTSYNYLALQYSWSISLVCFISSNFVCVVILLLFNPVVFYFFFCYSQSL